MVMFWEWLARGNGGKRGYRRVVNRWLMLHLGVGLALGVLAHDPMKEISRAVLLPLAGVLVGLAFAWAGNAQALLQTEQIHEFSSHRPGGYVEYVYTYQLAILVLLVTLSFWGITAIGVWDDRWPTARDFGWYLGVKCVAFTCLSVAVRECWHVVLGAQLMLIARKRIDEAQHKCNRA